MVKGVAVKLRSYEETIPKLLKVIKFDEELRKHDKVVLKPNLVYGDAQTATRVEFVEQVLKFCMEHKNPGSEIFIAEGCDGHNTSDVFEDLGYTALAEKYGIGLIDLNHAESEEIHSNDFMGFESVHFPKILQDSFVISLPLLHVENEARFASALDNMIGAFPAKHYKGFLASGKNKLRKYPWKCQVHDITTCKMPDFAIIDASEWGTVIAGQPLEMDKQAAKALGQDWYDIDHLRLIDDRLSRPPEELFEEQVEELVGGAS